MEIKVMRNSVYCKQPCLACGVRDYPGDVAFFTESGEWLCDWCVETGEGFPRLRALVAERGAEEERLLGDVLMEELYSFVGKGWEQEDDIILLTLECSPNLS